jgi:hypothetical protein
MKVFEVRYCTLFTDGEGNESHSAEKTVKVLADAEDSALAIASDFAKKTEPFASGVRFLGGPTLIVADVVLAVEASIEPAPAAPESAQTPQTPVEPQIQPPVPVFGTASAEPSDFPGREEVPAPAEPNSSEPQPSE